MVEGHIAYLLRGLLYLCTMSLVLVCSENGERSTQIAADSTSSMACVFYVHCYTSILFFDFCAVIRVTCGCYCIASLVLLNFSSLGSWCMY